MKKKIFCAVVSAAVCMSFFSSCDEEKISSTENISSGSNTDSETSSPVLEDVTLPVKTVTPPVTGGTGNIGDWVIDTGEQYLAMKIKGYTNEIIIKLYPEYEPKAVEVVSGLTNDGYYNGKKIHRIGKDFMFQGGSKNGDGLSGSGGEPSFPITTNENMRHIYGAFCMANNQTTGNGAQFYVINNSQKNAFANFSVDTLPYMLNDPTYANTVKFAQNATDDIKKTYNELGGYPYLDGGYTVFGQVVEGWEVVDAVSALPVKKPDDNPINGEETVPVNPVFIEKMEIRTK